MSGDSFGAVGGAGKGLSGAWLVAVGLGGGGVRAWMAASVSRRRL